MTATTILLGNLRLVGEPRRSINGGVSVAIEGDEGLIIRIGLSDAEFASLQSVAAVVEAAKEWREKAEAVKAEVTYSNALRRDEALARLRAAIDTLTAGGEK